MSRILYLECTSGISGDMFVASLLDLGADAKMLEAALQSLGLPGFKIAISRVSKNGLDACDFHVVLDGHYENHDHDMSYLHGGTHVHGSTDVQVKDGQKYTEVQGHTVAHQHTDKHVHTHCHDEHRHDPTHKHGYDPEQKHGQDPEHIHEQDPEHIHEQDPEQKHGHGPEHIHEHSAGHNHTHEHRNLADILPIIESAEISAKAKKTAGHIFDILAHAEAKAHGVTVDEVHFHEVGAVDSIVDIVAAAVCLDNLGIEEVVVPVLHEGTGFVRCQHGIIPVPVPAVAAIVQEHDLPIHMNSIEGEFVTPTGAAIVAAIRTRSRLPEEFNIVEIGIGAGKRTYERPSLLRAMLIQENPVERDCIYSLESSIDDCTGEALGYVMERLLKAGARDVNYIPVYMKKNRPAYQLNVLCKEKDIEKLEEIIFMETTTIGIRRQRMERDILKREVKLFQTSLGQAAVKICSLPRGERIYPEYDSVAALSRETGLAWQDVRQLIIREYKGMEK